MGCGRKASTIDDEAALRWLTNYDIAPSTHASAYLANPKTKLVATVSRNRQSLEKFAARWKTPELSLYTDYKEMLRREKPDIVSVTTHADARAQIVIDAARAGAKGILCEKAMATSLEEADQMLEACRASGTKLLVNHPRRYHPTYARAKELLDSGAIGTLRSISGAMWTFLIHNGIHLWDMLRYFAGDADWVSGAVLETGESDPGGYGLVHFKSGVFAFADVATMRGFTLSLFGSDGTIETDMFRDGLRIVLYEDAVRTGAQRPSYQFRPRRISHDERVEVRPTVPPMQAALNDLIESIEGDRDPVSSGEDGRAALEIGIAMHLSSRKEGVHIPIPVEGEGRRLRVVSR